MHFDVPSEEAGRSLPELARQAGVQVIAPGDKLRGVITPEINGVFDVNDALKLMLKGTGLMASRSPEGIVISPGDRNKSEEREPMSNHKNSVSLLALIVGILSGAQTATAAQARDINIPAEDLRTALDSYTHQSGVQLVYTDKDVDGLRSHAVEGHLEPAPALDQLLKGTQLAVNRDVSGTVAVYKRVTAAPSVQSGGDGGSVEQVTVTGSRIITNGNSSPTPLTVVSVQQLENITPSNVPDGLNKLPVFAGSTSQRSGGVADSNRTGNFLNLRGFGSQRTLILLDGNRVPATAANGTVDIDTLPQLLMSRVDVVTGGASAVYGSDAVTGVVNFILDKNYNGLKVNAQAGISSRGDDLSWKAGIAWGKDVFGGRGHVEASFEHYNSDGIHSMNDRPLGKYVYTETGNGTANNKYVLTPNSRNPQYTPGGYISTGPLANMFFPSNGVIAPYSHGIATGSPGDEMGGDGGYAGEALPGVNANPYLLYQLRTDHLFTRFDYDVTDNIHFYAQASGAQDYNYGVYFVQWFQAKVPTTNAYIPAAAQAILAANPPTTNFTLAKSIQDGHGYTNSAFTQNVDVTFGFNGTIYDSFNWELHYSYGQSRLHEADPYNLNNQRLQAALDSVISNGQVVCRVSTNPTTAALYPGCLPYNPFGPNAENPAALQYIDGYTDFNLFNAIQDVAGSVNGTVFDGWAGPVKAAVSGEYRIFTLQNKSNFQPTAKVNCAGLNPVSCDPTATLWTSDLGGAMNAKENVWEGAVELDVPVLKDLPLIQMLDVNAAARYTQYSISGAATTWKLGTVWSVVDDLSVRATTSRDIRAPTLFDLYAPTSVSLSSYADLLTGVSSNTSFSSQGNPALKPEVARTTTAGFVYSPGWIPRLSVAVDMFQIGISNAVTSIDGRQQTYQNQCNASGGTAPFCALYIRPISATSTSPANYPTAVFSESLNVAKTSTHGVDVEVNYNFDLADIDSDDLEGTLNTRLLATYQPSLLSQAIPGAVITNAAGATGLAAGRVALDVGYTDGPFSISGEERYLSSERQNSNPTLLYSTPSIPPIFYTDMTLGYSFKMRSRDADNAAQAFLSVQNVFDQQPHVYSSTGVTGAQGFAYPVPRDEDFIGRYFTVGIKYKL